MNDVIRTSNPKLPPEAPRMTPTEADRLIEWHQMAAQASEQTDYFAGARWHREKLAAWRAWRGVARASDETFDDLLYRIHRELARGHSSAALAVVAAALEHRPLPVCTACDVVTLNQNAQKAVDQRAIDANALADAHRMYEAEHGHPFSESEGEERG